MKLDKKTFRVSTVVTLLGILFVVGSLLAGCASTKVTEREQDVTGQIPRPANVWVYDFVATAGDVPADSAFASQPDLDTTPQTAEQLAQKHKNRKSTHLN